MATPIKRCGPCFAIKDGSKPGLVSVSEEQGAYVAWHEFAALGMNMGAIVRGVLIICHLHIIRMKLNRF